MSDIQMFNLLHFIIITAQAGIQTAHKKLRLLSFVGCLLSGSRIKSGMTGVAISSVCTVLLLAGCGAAVPVEEAKVEVPAVSVEAKKISELAHLTTEVQYPGVVMPDQEVRVTAVGSGVVKNLNAELGATVKSGAVLAYLTDPNAVGSSGALVESARLAVEQARTALEQAKRNIGHTGTTTSDSVRSAELAVESANLAVEQARTTLANKRITAAQAESDAETNGLTTATTYANSAAGVLDGLNNMTGFDDKKSVTITYTNYLGALDTKTFTAADSNYDTARRAYDEYLASSCDTASSCLSRTSALLGKIKLAVDSVVAMLDKSVAAADFPLTSATITSLSSLKSTATSYQTTINTGMSAVNSSLQTIQNTKLANTTTIDQLEQSLTLAEKQAAQATQSLASLRATNTTSKDSVTTQKTQAEIAYQNALVNYQNLTNNREVVSPIDGKITKKAVVVGDAVTPGQLLYTVSKTGNVKVEVYVDAVHQALIREGLEVKLIDGSKQEFTAKVFRIAPQADSLTKRFLVELLPSNAQNFPRSGSVVDVYIPLVYTPITAGNFFVPLASVTVGQNESTIYTIADNKAQRAIITVVRVVGEHAEVRDSLPPETFVILDGARNVVEGSKINVQ